MPVAALDDVDLYFEERGEGPVLLYVGGTGSDLRVPPSPLGWPIMKGFRAIAFDHRGLGQSVPRNQRSQPTMADFANNALQLLDHLAVDRFALVGVSFGGMVALEIALRANDRIDKLVLMCTSSGGAGGSSAPLHEVYRYEPPQRRDAALRLLGDSRIDTDPEVTAFFDALAKNRGPVTATDGLLQQLDARAGHDTWDRLGSIDVPTFIAAGRFDPMAPLANAIALNGAIAGSELRIYEGGHPFFFQDRQAFSDTAMFLQS
jgi:3-oxoadipate enol-lactonase